VFFADMAGKEGERERRADCERRRRAGWIGVTRSWSYAHASLVLTSNIAFARSGGVLVWNGPCSVQCHELCSSSFC